MGQTFSSRQILIDTGIIIASADKGDFLASTVSPLHQDLPGQADRTLHHYHGSLLYAEHLSRSPGGDSLY